MNLNSKKKTSRILVNTLITCCILLLAYLVSSFIYSFFQSYLKCSVSVSFYVSLSIGSFIVFSAVLSKSCRCLALLIIPQFFSKNGRATVLTYVMLLTFSGPVENMLHNSKVMYDGLLCTGDQLKLALLEVEEMFRDPLNSMIKMIKEVMPGLRGVFERLEVQFQRIKTVIQDMAESIEDGVSWIKSVVNVCDETQGTPFQKCEKSFRKSILRCREALGAADVFCDLAYLAKMFCYTFKAFDVACSALEKIGLPMKMIVSEIEDFGKNILDVFYFEVKIDHNFEFETNASKTFRQVKADIIREIELKLKIPMNAEVFIEGLTILLFLFMFFKAVLFKIKFNTSLEFKNFLITKEFVEIDKKRPELGLETVLPLTNHEKEKYIEVSSLTLVAIEIKLITRKALMLVMTTFYVLGILAADFSYFWFLSMIHFIGSQEKSFQDELTNFVMKSFGNSFLEEIVDNLSESIQKMMKFFGINIEVCLPRPSRTEMGKYMAIASLLSLCWLLLILEPVAMRLRTVIMHHFYPKRGFQRVLWLHERILRKRSRFFSFTKKQTRFSYHEIEGKSSEAENKNENCMKICWIWIKMKFIGFNFARKIIKPENEVVCLRCRRSEKSNIDLFNCETKSCPGIYCFDCLIVEKTICLKCKNPLESGDLTDFFDEIDSSDEEIDEIFVNSQYQNQLKNNLMP